ncbi:MAG: response regulator [Cellulosilyticaceae bacterium]
MMYKVMLADDEKLILNGIRAIIDWDKLGLEVVEMATNGEEALEKFKKNPCDIVVTDINMPKIDGLMLLKEIKKTKENVKFIILSGYDEFAYAKKAIELGVERYILKPIDEVELEETLLQTILKLNQVSHHRTQLIDKHTKILKFIEEGITPEERDDYETLVNIDFNAEAYCIASLTFDKAYLTKSNISKIIEKVQDENKQYYPNNNQLEIFYNMHDSILLINSWDTEDMGIIKNYYKTIQQTIAEAMEVKSFLAIGECVFAWEHIKKTYRTAKQLQKYRLLKGYGAFVDTTYDYKSVSGNIDWDATKLHKLIIESDKENAIKYIEEIFDEIKKSESNLENIYHFIMRLAILIQEIIDDFKIDKMNHMKGINDVVEEICTGCDFEKLKNIFVMEVEEIILLINTCDVKYTPVVQQVVTYIHENYWEDMNLKTLAYKYNINTSYLGQIFLKEVGFSFSQYLSDVKNSKAKDLILNTNMKINDIAKAVGYPDTSYFYRKFKKHYGVSPATLREMKQY